MSSFAPIWSPAVKQKLLIFGVSDNAHLNLRSFNAADKQSPTTPTDTSDLENGIIAVPSSIVGVQYDDWTRVYGFINKKSSDGNLKQHIYMLSPVHERMPGTDITSEYLSLAGVSDGETNAYLYYVDETLKLREFDLKGGNDPKTIDTVGLLKHTSLAACLGANSSRYVAYQLGDVDEILQVYNLTDSAPLPQISGSVGSKSLTPLAIVQYEKDSKSYINLYWLRSKSNLLMRSQRVGEGAWVEKVLKDAGAPSQSTTLSATWDKIGSQVILSFKLEKGEFVCMKDKW